MKLLSASIALFVLMSITTISAHAENYGSKLSCETLTKGEYDLSLKVEVRDYYTYENTLPGDEGVEIIGAMKDLSVSAAFTDYDGVAKTETGRRDYVQSDRKYAPYKYKNTLRFNFDELTNTETFGDFSPSDSCSINFMLPKDAEKLGAFKAYAVVNCDQSGGSQTLACTLTPNKKSE